MNLAEMSPSDRTRELNEHIEGQADGTKWLNPIATGHLRLWSDADRRAGAIEALREVARLWDRPAAAGEYVTRRLAELHAQDRSTRD